MRKYCLLVLSLVLCGCATQKVAWEKPGATQASFQLDTNQCKYEATLATPSASYTPTIAAAVAQGISEGIRQNQLHTLCMNARGYVLRNVEQ